MGTIKRFAIPSHSIAWYNFRRTGLTDEDCKLYGVEHYAGGIGASECSKLFYEDENKTQPINPYDPCLAELFHHKVGTETPTIRNNSMTVNGLFDEDKIRLFWCLYDGTDTGVWDNAMRYKFAKPGERTKLLVRRSHGVHAYLVNTDYPYLFVSLDNKAENGTPSISGVVYDNGFPVEFKTLNGYMAKKWEIGMPEYHIVQVNQQMLITESDYAEVAWERFQSLSGI